MALGCMSCVVDVIITGGDEEDACMVVHPDSLSGIIESWGTIHFPLCVGWWISNRGRIMMVMILCCCLSMES